MRASRRLGRVSRLLLALWVVGHGLPSPSEAEPADPGADPPALPSGEHDPPASPLLARTLRGLDTRVVASLLGPDTPGELNLAALALPLPRVGEPTRLPITVEIDGPSILRQRRGAVERIEVYVYALEPSGGVADFLAEAFVVDVEERGEEIWSNGFELRGGLELPPGTYTLRVLARHAASNAMGRTEIEVVVPAADVPAILPLLIPQPADRDRWIPVVQMSRRGDERSAGVADPAGILSGFAALPVMKVGEEVVASLPTFHVRVPGAEPRIELAGEAGRFTSPIDLGPKVAFEPESALHLRTARFRVPDVPAGTYRVRTSWRSAEGLMVSSPLRVAIVASGTRDAGLLWPDVRWLLGGDRLPAAGEEVQRPGRLARGRRVRDLADDYREALTRLSEGSEAARSSIFDLEAALVGRSDDADALEDLREAELRVLSSLGRSEAGLIAPAVVLHQDLFELYRNRRLYDLLGHSRRLLEEMARVAVSQPGEEGARLSAEILMILGVELQKESFQTTSRRLFQRVVELVPDHRGALLHLASIEETSGEYGRAVSLLERLLSHEPAHAEARLRLAVSLSRLGQPKRSRELFRGLLTAEDRWIRSLAHQEIAFAYLEEGDSAEAESVLAGALEESLDPQRTALLLAYVYDRAGRPRRALETLRSVDAESGDGDSPRRIYDRWPRHEGDRSRRWLESAAEAARSRFLDIVSEASRSQR